jgi:hypothetical protein
MDEREKPDAREDASADDNRTPYAFPGATPGGDDRSLVPAKTDDTPDVQLAPIAAGCGASCVASFVCGLLMFMGLTAAGVDVARSSPDGIPPVFSVIGFLAGLGTTVLAGYVAARMAVTAKRLHALVIGIILMVLSLLAIVVPVQGASKLAAILQFILDIPMAYWGASIAIAQDER